MTGVAFLADRLLSPVPGPMGTYTRELIPAVERADPSVDITLFHARSDASRSQAWTTRRPVVQLPLDVGRLYPSWALFGRPPLPEPLASLDLVHTPVPAAVPPPAPGQRLVVTVHDLAFLVVPEAYTGRWRLMYRVALRRAVRVADAIVTPSRHTAEDLLRHTRYPEARVHVVPLAPPAPDEAADPEEILARLKVRPPFVLFVGTLEPRKNVARLVRAYRRLAARGAPHRLVLAGPMGREPAELMRELAEDGSGEVVLVGPLGRRDLDGLYRCADAFVCPSLYEGFGLPLLEAMSRGVPCVVAASSSLPEVAGEAALPVDPRSEEGLAEAIERITTDRELAGRLRRAGIARAARFTWDETARRTLEVYKAVLESP